MTVPLVFLILTTRNKIMDMTMSSIRPNRVEVVTSEVEFALACIARGRAVRAVCIALSISRSY